jgi:hypothetical protein
MNLFRAEEHVRNWPDYDPLSAESIMPISDWATAFSGSLFKKRLQPDYLNKWKEYAPEMLSTLQKFGKSGPFWVPE